MIGYHQTGISFSDPKFYDKVKNGQPIQFFSRSPRSFVKENEDDLKPIEKLMTVGKIINKRNIIPIIHSGYASSFVNIERPEVYRTIKHELLTLINMKLIGISFVVMYSGRVNKKTMSTKDWIGRYSVLGKMIKEIGEKKMGKIIILVENVVGGFLISDFVKIEEYLIQHQDDSTELQLGYNYSGYVINTSQLWGSLEPIETENKVKDFCEKELSKLRVLLSELNDSKVKYGEKRDRHERVGRGYMADILPVFINWFNKNSIPMIIEDQKKTKKDIAWVRDKIID